MLARETEIVKVVSSLRMLDSLIKELGILSDAQRKHLKKARIKTIRVDQRSESVQTVKVNVAKKMFI